MLDYILKNTLYKVHTKSGDEYVGTIDEISSYFDDGITSMERVDTAHQFKELKGFFSDLDKYSAEHGYTYIEDFYKIWDKSEVN